MAQGFTRLMPAVREAMPFGDFRDWPAIDDWARSIAHELQEVPVTV
jgi:menaquinone-dependent protoporphyrinogen oxidase